MLSVGFETTLAYAFSHFSKEQKELPLNLKEIFRSRTTSHKEKFNNLLTELSLENRITLTDDDVYQILIKLFQHIFQAVANEKTLFTELCEPLKEYIHERLFSEGNEQIFVIQFYELTLKFNESPLGMFIYQQIYK